MPKLKYYEQNSGQWEELLPSAISDGINTFDVNRIKAIEDQLIKTNKQMATISHGLNVVNSSQNSFFDIQIEGQTLSNVSQNVLDVTKYYVLSDKKSKIKFSDGTTYAGTAKFQGKAEKPILIRMVNFEEKVAGSTLENSHFVKSNVGSVSLQPPNGTWSEVSGAVYSLISRLDGTLTQVTTNANGFYAQTLFSFNLIEAIERNVGKIPASNVTEKITWLKTNINKLIYNWWGYGSCPNGNKATIQIWNSTNSEWTNSNTTNTHTNNSITKIFFTTSIMDHIDSNGFTHLIAYSDPSNGSMMSTINTDYVELEIELKQNAQLNFPRFPLYEVDATTEYPNILTIWDETEVQRRYPIIESVQHAQNPYIIAESDNLFPPFTEWLHGGSGGTSEIIASYKFKLSATNWAQYRFIKIPLIKNQQYTISVVGQGRLAIDIIDKNNTFIVNNVSRDNGINLTFTPIVDGEHEFRFKNGSQTGTFIFEKPMLNLGSTAKPFVPRNHSMLFAEVKLGAIGDKKDILWKDENGQWIITRHIEKDVVL